MFRNNPNESIIIRPDADSDGFIATLRNKPAMRLYLKDIDAIENYLDLVFRCIGDKAQQVSFEVPGFPTVIRPLASARAHVSEDFYEQLELLVESEAWPFEV